MSHSVKTIIRSAILYSIAALCLTLFLNPSFQAVSGLMAGAFVGIGNFALLARGVSSFFSSGGGVNRWGVLFVLRLFPLILLTGLLILVVQVSPAAFVAGFFSIVFGIVYEGVKSAVEAARS